MRLNYRVTLAFACIVFLASCTKYSKSKGTSSSAASADTTNQKVIVIPTLRKSILVTDEELNSENAYNHRADELFDDFLYNYILDSELREQRTQYPLTERMLNGEVVSHSVDTWQEDFAFLQQDYATNIYNNEQEMSINEDTTIMHVSLEKINLSAKSITKYLFERVDDKWTLQSIDNIAFSKSDLNNFLSFYSSFCTDSTYQHQSIAKSVHISISDPDDNSQTMDGFITRDQWSTISSGIPTGVITCIRYGQSFRTAKNIMLEKISIGDGMSETFIFARKSLKWELVGYEN